MKKTKKLSYETGFVFKTKKLKRNPNIENPLEAKSEFEILRFLGDGSYGKVSHVKHRQTGQK